MRIVRSADIRAFQVASVDWEAQSDRFKEYKYCQYCGQSRPPSELRKIGRSNIHKCLDGKRCEADHTEYLRVTKSPAYEYTSEESRRYYSK